MGQITREEAKANSDDILAVTEAILNSFKLKVRHCFGFFTYIEQFCLS